jgi:serine/threonine protein kinase
MSGNSSSDRSTRVSAAATPRPHEGRAEVTPAAGHEPETVSAVPVVEVPSAPSELPHLGPYQLRRRIGGGGMGVVYEAWHTKLHRKVALKTLRSDWMHDPRMVARFHREMAAVGRLNHPNLVRATDADEIDGCHFLIMDFEEGLDLSRVVRNTGPLPVPDACEVARRVALGLDYIHAQGLVHRDVKPSNLMLTDGGEVKVLDLGLALLREAALAGERSAGGQRLGTADYMAPEQADDAHGVDIRADLYSLGCALYQLLTGRAPFAGEEDSIKKALAHALAPVVPASSARHEVPAELDAVLGRLLAKTPAARFAVPADVARALEPFAAGHDLPAVLARARGNDQGTPPGGGVWADPFAVTAPQRVPSPPPTATAPPRSTEPPPPRRWPTLLYILTGVLLLSAAALGVWHLVRPRPEPSPGPPPPIVPPPPVVQTEPPVVWPQDYPRSLRDRAWQQPVALLQKRPDRPDDWPDLSGARIERSGRLGDPLFQPSWCRRLHGTGMFEPAAVELRLWSGTDRQPTRSTLLALDDDLRRRWFEFSAELQQQISDHFHNPRGVFFGWQEVEPGKARAYFVQVDPEPAPAEGYPQGRVVVGPAVLDLRPEAAATATVVPLPPFRATPPRTVALTAPGQKYLVHVRAIPGKVIVQVNAENPIEFEPPFDPRGPMGIWVQDGGGRFRTATVTALHLPDAPGDRGEH